MAVSQERISVHSLADLKNTTDDALPIYLNSLKFTQSHTLTDVRLILGYSAFTLCAATFYWDYTHGFESTKNYTAIAVAIYTLLNTALTIWIWGVEKSTVYVGTNHQDETITVQSKVDKHRPVYRLTVTCTAKDGRKSVKRLDKAFSGWFDAKGHFVVKPFQRMMASNFAIIGKVDPKNAVKEEKKVDKDAPMDNRSMDEKWTSLLAESDGTAASTATPEKSTKKRGKKAA